jgi:hypothetical protein
MLNVLCQEILALFDLYYKYTAVTNSYGKWKASSVSFKAIDRPQFSHNFNLTLAVPGFLDNLV